MGATGPVAIVIGRPVFVLLGVGIEFGLATRLRTHDFIAVERNGPGWAR